MRAKLQLLNRSLMKPLGFVLLLTSAQVFAFSPPEPEPPEVDPPCTSCDFTRGPNPTEASVEAEAGPYLVNSFWVDDRDGFGGGTVFYPVGTVGSMAAIAVMPGFTASESSMRYIAERYASFGFVAISVQTNSPYDPPGNRGGQMEAALDYLIELNNDGSSAISGMVDGNRLGATGHSMGGGASLILAQHHNVDAVVPIAAYESTYDFDDVEIPALVIACEEDGTAPNNRHSGKFYNDIPDTTDKAYMVIADEEHGCVHVREGEGREEINKYALSWMKRFLDDDERYDQFLCGNDRGTDPAIAEWRDTCDFTNPLFLAR